MAPFPFNPGNQYQQSVTMRDAKGNTGVFRFFMDVTAAATLGAAHADVLTVINAFTPLSNAALQNTRGLVSEFGVAQYGAHAVGGAYESIVDKAVLVFQDNSGQLHRFEIPAPKIAIFKADKITVDPAAATVITFINAMTTVQAGGSFVASRQDIALANYMGGFYKARKIRRRLNVLVLQPDLTASLPAE